MSSTMDPINIESPINDASKQLTICEIFGIDDDGSFKKHFCAENHFKGMKHIFDTQQLCDVVLIAGNNGEKISARRVVLAASSPYFLEKFQESLPSDSVEITVKNIDGVRLRKILNFCYTSEMELRLNDMDMILAIAYKLQLHSLASAYYDVFHNYLNISNWFNIASKAQEYNIDALRGIVERYMLHNFMKVYKDSTFLAIDLALLRSLLASTDLTADSEEDVFEAIMLWVEHAPSERMSLLPDLLNLLRFELLDPRFILNRVRPVCNANNCSELVLNALKNLIVSTEDAKRFSCSRHTVEQNRILVIVKDSKGEPYIGEYCRLHGVSSWTRIGSYSIGWETIAVNNNQLFIYTDTQFQSFDIKTKTVTTLSHMLNEKCNFCFALLQGDIYALGGYENNKISNRVERYNPKTHTWTFAPEMLEGRLFAKAVVLNDVLYVIGGNNDQSSKTTMESYCPMAKKWTSRRELRTVRSYLGAAAGNRFLYALGGYVNKWVNTVERYDPNTNEWTQICSLSTIDGSVCCAMLGNRLLAMQGKKIEEYDEKQDEWSIIDPIEFDIYTILSTRYAKLDISCPKCN